MQHGRANSVLYLFLLQLLVSFMVVGTVAVTLDKSGFGAVVSIMLGCLVGLLLTANLAQALFSLHVVLDRLSHALPVDLPSLYRYWPLHAFFRLLKELDQQRGQQIQQEQRTVVYEDQLLQQVVKTTAQEERNRLARDLHDSIKQQIFSITMSAAAAKVRWEHDKERVRPIIDDIERVAREAQVEMQAMLQQLRPDALENIGLVESLRMQCQALEYRSGVQVCVEIEALPAEELLPAGAHEMLFRIAQEGLANIARHARASHVWLSLYQQGQNLLLEIGDDGRGFDLNAASASQSDDGLVGGMGMKNVYERVAALQGTVQVWSRVGQGTTLHVSIPLVKRQQSITAKLEAEDDALVSSKWTRLVARIGIGSLDLVTACILLNVPSTLSLTLIPACLVISFLTWIVAQFQRLPVAISLGRTHAQHLCLLANSYRWLAGIVTLALFYVGYLNYAWLQQPWMLMGIALALLALLLYVLTCEQYGKRLSLAGLRVVIKRQQQEVIIDFLAWLFFVGFASFCGLIAPTIHLTAAYWEQNAALLLGVLWLLAIVAKGIQIVRWQYMLHT
jgi:signal transduction histidine kinase